MKLISCVPARHSDAILAIFNEAIANSTALYDYQLRTRADMTAWFDYKARKNYPVIGMENAAGEFMGFASYGQFRERPAYKYTVEHSVYVDTRFRGQGIGRRLLEATIDAANAVSIRLHEKFGFSACGIVRQAGFKFGRWLDLAFYQLILSTPAAPMDG